MSRLHEELRAACVAQLRAHKANPAETPEHRARLIVEELCSMLGSVIIEPRPYRKS